MLGSSVLGICLIHLSESLRWIYIGCQVPVIIERFLQEVENEIGKTEVPPQHRQEETFLFKCKEKKRIKQKQIPTSMSRMMCLAALALRFVRFTKPSFM